MPDTDPCVCPRHTLDELKYLLTASARSRGRKQLSCAGDVLTALRDDIPPAEPRLPGRPSLALLTGVEIVEELSFEPGHFCLIKHDNCDVDTITLTVHHGRCYPIADGVVCL